MLKTRLARAFCVLFLFSALPGPVPAQQPAAIALPPPLAPQGANRRLSLDVVVTDNSGKPASGLTLQDFSVIDNKLPQKLAAVQAADRTTAAPDPPVEAILVLDNYNEGAGNISREHEDLKKFFAQNSSRLPIPVTLVIFSNSGIRATNHPTLSGTALSAYLDQVKTETPTSLTGFYGALDRYNKSLETLRTIADSDAARRPARKLLIWMGRGWPVVTNPQVMQTLTKKQEDTIFKSIVVTSNILRQNRITVYDANSVAVGNLSEDTTWRAYIKGATSGADALFGNLELEVVSMQTGGRVLNSSSDLADDLNKCFADAGAFYTLSFDAPPATHPDEYHSITVTVDKPGFTARSLTSYYSQP